MKKIFLLLAIAIIAMLSQQASAQKFEIQGRVGADLALDQDAFNNGGSLDVMFGYRITPLLRVGGGIGYQQFVFIKAKESGLQWEEDAKNIPVFADVKFNFTKSKFSPFVNAQVGAITNGKYEEYGDINMNFMYKAGIGFDINFERGALFFEADFKRIEISSNSVEYMNLDSNPSFIGLSVGYIFKL